MAKIIPGGRCPRSAELGKINSWRAVGPRSAELGKINSWKPGDAQNRNSLPELRISIFLKKFNNKLPVQVPAVDRVPTATELTDMGLFMKALASKLENMSEKLRGQWFSDKIEKMITKAKKK